MRAPLRSISTHAHPALFVVVFTSLFLPSAAAAQPPPAPETCDQQDSGARIKCKFGNVIAQQQAAAEMISGMPETSESERRALTNPLQALESGSNPSRSCELRRTLGPHSATEDPVTSSQPFNKTICERRIALVSRGSSGRRNGSGSDQAD